MKPRVRDCISSLDRDIDLDAILDARVADAAVGRCVAAVTDCLKLSTPQLGEAERVHLHQIFLSMRHGYAAVRELLRPEGEQPKSVNVMSLVRAQVETLYAVCLIIEKPETLHAYLKDGWKKLFIRHIAMQTECRGLPRVARGLSETEVWLERMRISAGVTDIEKRTIEAHELGGNLPGGTRRLRLPNSRRPAA